MMKLNNKGMTAVEILVCMVLIVVITVSMYSSVSSYKNKQQIESFKEKIMTYKNLITKEINDDLIKDGLISATVTDFTEVIHNDLNGNNVPDSQEFVDTNGNGVHDFKEDVDGDGYEESDVNKDGVPDGYTVDRNGDGIRDGDIYSVAMTFRSGNTKCLKIRSTKGYDYLFDGSDEEKKKDVDDKFYIEYGDGDCIRDTEPTNLVTDTLIKYSLPDVGHTYKYEGETDASGNAIPKKKIYDLRINNVNISTENSVLDIYVGLYHPDLGTRYALSIICPINY